MADEILVLDQVRKAYNVGTSVETEVLHGIDLVMRRGQFLALMGPSGSGKSTLMNIIGLMDRPTGGRYHLDGIDVGKLGDDELSRLRGRLFGFVFQSYNLVPRLTALEQVELPLVYQGVTNRRKRAIAALRQVGLAERMNHRPTQLSGGQQQRVAIARSLVVSPRVILADEPTGALDTQTSHEVMALFAALVDERDITVIFVTHEFDVAQHARRIVRMSDGRVVEDGVTADVVARRLAAGVPGVMPAPASVTGQAAAG